MNIAKSEISARLRQMAEGAAELIYPTATYCLVCGNYVDNDRAYCICDHCIERIAWGNISIDMKMEYESLGMDSSFDAVSHLDSVRACFSYGLYGRRVVFELKYNGHSYVARVGAQIMADRVCTDPAAAEVLGCDFVTGVPVSRQRLRKRGFNQAEKLAKYFCNETGMHHISDALLRTKDTTALKSLSPQERYLNLQGAFELNERKLTQMRLAGAGNESIADDKHPLQDMRILMIDDIYTTGATVKQCARVLKEAGAAEVHALVLTTGSDFAIMQ